MDTLIDLPSYVTPHITAPIMASRADVKLDITPQAADDLENVKVKVPPLVENLSNNDKVAATPSVENPLNSRGCAFN